MKLKKIASLALAGVLAVSMLAGCGTNNGTNNGTDNKDEGTTVVSSASTDLYNELAKETRQRITKATTNSTLESTLKKAVETYVGDATVMADFSNSSVGAVTNAYYSSSNDVKAVVGEVANAVNANDTIIDNFKNTNKDTSCVVVYAVSGGVSDAYAVKLVAAELEKALASNNYERLPVTGVDAKTGKSYEYNYSISASVVTRSFEALGTQASMKFVAVVIDQAATEV